VVGREGKQDWKSAQLEFSGYVKSFMLNTNDMAAAKYKKWEKETTPHGYDGERISLLYSFHF
jgi:hypothetical protein